MIDASAVIAGQPPCGEDMAFTHSILCQVGLPRSRTGVPEFLRKPGDAWLSVQAELLDEDKGPVQQPLAYGSHAAPCMSLASRSRPMRRRSNATTHQV